MFLAGASLHASGLQGNSIFQARETESEAFQVQAFHQNPNKTKPDFSGLVGSDISAKPVSEFEHTGLNTDAVMPFQRRPF